MFCASCFGMLRHGSAENRTLSSNLSGTYQLAKTGPGTLTLSGTNTHSGGNRIDSGTLSIASGSALGAGPTVVNGTLAVTAGTTISTVLSGSGAVTMTTGNLVLSGANTFSGSITTTGGNLIGETNSNAFGGTPAVALNGGSLVLGQVYVGGTCSIGSLSGSSGASTVNPAYVAIAGTRRLSVTQTADASFAGALQDASGGRVLALTKGGSGTLTLNGSSTYTGGTIINAGTLKAGRLNAFGTGGITVNSGGTLDKTGYAISNAITNNGGTVLG